MTTATARTAANVILAVGGIAAAYVIMTTPPFRRLAMRTVRGWLGGSVPLYLVNEFRRAWMESAPAA